MYVACLLTVTRREIPGIHSRQEDFRDGKSSFCSKRGGAVGDSAENGCAGDDVVGPHSLLFWVYRSGAGVVQHGRKN